MSCVSPIYIKNTGPALKAGFGFPCGRCMDCLRRKAQGWAFRFEKEMDYNAVFQPLFLTLTYADEHLVYSNYGPTLFKPDIQLFMKRLRKHESKRHKHKLIYYCCGEYGPSTQRPHYHMVILNVSDPSALPSLWGKGNVHIGTATQASVAYTLKYMQKPVVQRKNPADDRVREFALMSKKIGSSWLEDEATAKDLELRKYLTTKRLDCVKLGNVTIALPRYVKERLFTKRQRSAIARRHEKRIEEDHQAKKQAYEADNQWTTYEYVTGLSKARKLQLYHQRLAGKRSKL